MELKRRKGGSYFLAPFLLLNLKKHPEHLVPWLPSIEFLDLLQKKLNLHKKKVMKICTSTVRIVVSN